MKRNLTLPILGLVLRGAMASAVDHAVVTQIHSPTELSIEGRGTCPEQRTRFRIDSQSGEGPLAYTETREVDCKGDRWIAKLHLIGQEEKGLVRDGDFAIGEDRGGGFPGRNDLVLSGPGRSSRHKALTHLGLVGETAETIDSGEVLVDMATRVFFGINDKLNVSTLAAAALTYPNISAKYRIWSRPWSTLSLGTSLVGTGYGSDDGMHLYSAGISLYYDSKSNTKSISHTVITFATPPAVYRQVTAPGDVLGSLTSSIRTGQQHIFDNWDRLIYGPQYMFETRSVGGYIAYIFVWDRFHLSIGLNVYDVTKLKLGVDGYVPNLFAYWRF